MNFSDIFKKSFMNMFVETNISTSKIIMTLFMASIIAFYIFSFYRIMTRKTFYNRNFNISLASIVLITTMVILTVQSNIVISLGMVGALSIVRFRTAIKDPMDLSFLFWAIAVGIACGAGMVEMAILGSFFLTLLMFILERIPVAKLSQILVINAEANVELMEEIKTTVNKYSKFYKVKSRNVYEGQLDVVIEVHVKAEDELLKAVQSIKEIKHVSLLDHDGEVTF